VSKDVIPIIAAIDDDFRIRESIASLLESAGYAILVFSSAEEFLQSGALATAMCVITDIRMPGINGLELQRRIRLERPTLPVILISAHHDAEVRRRAIDKGAVEVLFKPFDATDLIRVIEAALTNSR
jgi:FixJ family two-component response regulator